MSLEQSGAEYLRHLKADEERPPSSPLQLVVPAAEAR
jgi:hypothetical protein